MYSKRRQPRKQKKSRSGRRKTQRGGEKTIAERIAAAKAAAKAAAESTITAVADRVGQFRKSSDDVDPTLTSETNEDIPTSSSLEDTTSLSQSDTTTQTVDELKATVATLQDQINQNKKLLNTISEIIPSIFTVVTNPGTYTPDSPIIKGIYNRISEIKKSLYSPPLTS
jgi:hypothetical protein